MDIRLSLQSRGIPFVQSPNDQNEIRINCVFCPSRGTTQDFKQRLGINIVTSQGNCFNCGWKSRKAVQIVAKMLSLGEITTAEKYEREYLKVKLPEDFEKLAGRVTSHWGKVAKAYLKDRGITEDQIEGNKIGFSLMGRYAYRIIFPVYVEKKLEGLVTRSFVGKEPRYLNSPGMKTVYNIPRETQRAKLRINHGIRQTLIISEGIFKCFAIENALQVINSVALLGHTMTDRQEDIIIPDRWDEIVLFPDPDVQGSKGFIKVADRLSLKAGHDSLSMKLTVVWPIPNRQADEMKKMEIKYCYQNRIAYSEDTVRHWKFELNRRKQDE